MGIATYPMDVHHPPRLIYLNSAQARYVESESMYIWTLDEPITKPNHHMFVISVVECQIPYSFTIINTRNNRYWINNNLYTIDPGNYNINELIDQLKANHSALTFQYSEINNKMTITSSSSFTMKNDPVSQPFLKMLGFRFDEYQGLSSYTSDSVVNLSGYNAIYLFSNITSFAMDSFAKRGSNVLCKIPVVGVSNSIIFYENHMSLKQVVNSGNLNEIRVKIVDPFYTPLHLNYVDWSMTIQVEKVESKFNEDPETKTIIQPTQPINIPKKSKLKI